MPSVPRHILVITYWCWSDALVQAYTLPYLRIMLSVLPSGSTIHLVTLEKGAVPAGPVRREAGIVNHPYAYEPFGLRGTIMLVGLLFKLWRLVRAQGIDTIHAWCTPAGMIGYMLSRITTRPLVVDSYEPHAGSMVENGTWSRKGVAYRTLFFFEKLQTRRATVLIAAASGMREYARSAYGISVGRFHVKPACVDLEQFATAQRKDPALVKHFGLEGKLVVVYAGKFGGIYLGQEVFDLIRAARDHWGERLHVLLLTGHSRADLQGYMDRAGLSGDLFTILAVPHQAMPVHMGLGDIALTPVRPVPTKRYCTPIKDGEYWAMGLPVIITPGISDDSDIIRENNIGAVLEGLNAAAYTKAVQEVDALLRNTPANDLHARIRSVAEKYRHFRIAEQVYTDIYGTPE